MPCYFNLLGVDIFECLNELYMFATFIICNRIKKNTLGLIMSLFYFIFLISLS